MRILLILFCGIILISCDPKVLPTISEMSENRVEVKFSHQTTKSEMELISNSLRDNYNIGMDYSKSTFFENGNLRDLNLTVVLANGTGGRTTAMLASLQYNYCGFIVDLNEGAVSPFKIGLL